MPIRIKPGRVAIPTKTYFQNWKFTIDDVNYTDEIINGYFTRRSLRYGVGSCEMQVWNAKGKYRNTFTGGEEIKVYFEHTDPSKVDPPTNQIFEGKVVSPKHNLTSEYGFSITLGGRAHPVLTDRKDISEDFSGGVAADAAIKAIIDDWFSGEYTYTNISADMTGTIYGTYTNVSAITMISDILKQVKFDGYIDFDNDIHTFAVGSNQNKIEKITYGDNCHPFNDFGKNYNDEINQPIVIGQTGAGLFLITQKNDSASQTRLWKKSEIYNEGNIDNIDVANQFADTKLDIWKSVPSRGILTAANGLPTLLPGQSIQCSIQYANISDWHNTSSFTHYYSALQNARTDVDISEAIKKVADVLSEQKSSLTSKSYNPHGMTHTASFLKFDSESEVSSIGDCVVSGGKLTLPSGTTSGICTTNTITMDNNVTSFELRAKPNDDCRLCYIKVSNDGGVTWNDSDTNYLLTDDDGKEFDMTTTGNKVIVEIHMLSDASNPSPELDSFTLLVKQ